MDEVSSEFTTQRLIDAEAYPSMENFITGWFLFIDGDVLRIIVNLLRIYPYRLSWYV